MKPILGPNPKPRKKGAIVRPTEVRKPDTRVAEEQFGVDMTKLVGGKPQTVSKTVDALTQADAIQRAQTGVPNAQGYAEIIARPMSGPAASDADEIQNARQDAARGPTVGTTPTIPAAPQTARLGAVPGQIKRGPGGLPEGFDAGRLLYPYRMVLPESIVAALRPMLKEGAMSPHWSRVQITVATPAEMNTLMKKMVESKSAAVREVIRGVMASMV